MKGRVGVWVFIKSSISIKYCVKSTLASIFAFNVDKNRQKHFFFIQFPENRTTFEE
jgi:hypothetical protein